MSRFKYLLTGVPLTFVSLPVISQQSAPYFHEHMWGSGVSGGWFMGFFMLIVLAIIVAIAIYVLRLPLGLNQGAPIGTKATEDPLNILKIRYAKGELDHDEYEQRRKSLES